MKKLVKSRIRSFINRFGYEIVQKQNGFSINPKVQWLRELNINTILDIGANEGQFVKFIHREIPDATIYSFEPILDCFKKLLNMKKNITKFYPYNYALGSRNESHPFYVNNFTPSSSMLEMADEHVINFPNTSKTNIINVKIKKLDSVIENFKIEKEVLVKIDVQGYEGEVIRGGENFFRKIPKIVLVEASITQLYNNEPTFEELFDVFRGMGYRYKGNINQLYSPINQDILQVDAIFIK